MLQDIRDKSQGMIVKVIIGFIIVTFALFGVEALVKSFSTSDKVAEVDGTDITRAQMLQAADLQRRQLISMSNGQIDPAKLQENVLQKEALNVLINKTLLINQAKSIKLGVSDAQVDNILLQSPEFQTNGKFDQTKYLNFVRMQGYTPLALKTQLKESILMRQATNAVAASDFVLPYQLDAIAQLQSQERSYDYVTFSLADQAEKTSVSDAELKAYYDAHKSEFKSPEQVKIDYVVLSPKDFTSKVKVTDADLQDAYKAFVAGLPKEERKAAHILIDTSDRTDKEAKARLEEVEKKLAAGASFASLAKEYSDDIGSKKAGGDLGYITKGTMVKPFEDAVFEMKKGDVKAVKTKFGWHLIKLEDIKDAKVPSFDDKKAELEKAVVAKKASEALFNAHENITDLAYASDQLEPLAKEYGVKVQHSDYFTRDGGTTAITANPSVVNAAYSDTVLKDGQNSNLIELKDQVVVIHLKDHKPESLQTFEQAQKEVTSKVVQEKAEAAIKAKAEAAKTASNTKWTSVKLAKRGENEVASLAFSMKHPDGKPVVDIKTLENGDLALIRLNKVQAGVDKATDSQAEMYKEYLDKTQSQMDLASQHKWLEDKADIDRKSI